MVDDGEAYELYPLGIVVHAAGVLQSVPLLEQNMNSMLACISPKGIFMRLISGLCRFHSF